MTAPVVTHLMDEFSSAVTRFAAAANGRYNVPVESLMGLSRALGSIDGLDTDKLREAAHVAARGGAGVSSQGDVAPVSSVVEQGSGVAQGFFSRFFQREKDSYDREREHASELDEQMQQCCDAVDSIADDSNTAIREIFLAAVPVLQVLTLLLGRSPWGVAASAAIAAGGYLIERTTTTAQETCRDRDEAIEQCLDLYLECCEGYCAEQESDPPGEVPEAEEPAEPEAPDAPATDATDPIAPEPAGEEPTDQPRNPKEPGVEKPGLKTPEPEGAKGPVEPAVQPSTPTPDPAPAVPVAPAESTELPVAKEIGNEDVEKQVNAGKVATQPAAQVPAPEPPAPEPAPPLTVEPTPPAPEPEPVHAPEPTPVAPTTPEPTVSVEIRTDSVGAQSQINLNVIVMEAATAASLAADHTFGAGAGATAVESMAAEVDTQVRQAVESVPAEAYLGVLGLVGAGLAAVSWEACVCCLEAAAAECEAMSEPPAATPEPEVEPVAVETPEPGPPPKPDVVPPPAELAEVEEPTPPPKKGGAIPESPEPPEAPEVPEPDKPDPIATETAVAQESAESEPDPDSADTNQDDHQTEERPVDPLGEQRTRKAGTW